MMNKIESILKKAGKLLKKQYYRGTGFCEKERYHLLSETDLEMHVFLKEYLQLYFPQYTIISEEDDVEKAVKRENSNRIIIDPIDGTTNFITGKPYFTISVALEQSYEIIEAHVYNPISGEYYYADKKTGKAHYNRELLHVPPAASLEESIVVLGLSYNLQKMKRYLKEWSSLLNTCRKCLFWVAPAQTICNVARGRIDIFIDMGSSMFGQAAASLILHHTGGKMCNYDGSPYDHRIKGGIFVSQGIDFSKVMKTRTF